MDNRKVTNEIASWLRLTLIAVIAVLICRQFVFLPTTVKGESMMPSLQDGNRVILSKITHIDRFDEVVFHATDSPDKYVKRVIGLPGDTVEMKDDTLYINGEPYEEEYLNEHKSSLGKNDWFTEDFTLKELTGKEEVPEGQMFVLGDNRPYSKDSRVFGFVPMERIVGEVKLRYWPVNDIGFVM
ncbi:signal peptidase I [Pradoshia sp.]